MLDLKKFLDEQLSIHNRPSFVEDDPISIPHQFSQKTDMEIIGFWTAILSWGQRKTIIHKSMELCKIMDYRPYEFVMHHSSKDLKPLEKFVHRTFNSDDALYFVAFFKRVYSKYESLEDLCLHKNGLEAGINQLREFYMADENYQSRNGKHVSSPIKNSSCKRINMFLRWMVRKDSEGVDFGIWNRINSSQLYCPLDVHVEKSARKLGLLTRTQRDWKAVLELTKNLQLLDPMDPIKYDLALFGLSQSGLLEKMSELPIFDAQNLR